MKVKKDQLTEDDALAIAKAIGDPRRYEILKRLGDGDKAISCESIRGSMDISPATLSHHMKELETAGLVEVEREGKFAYYRLRRGVLKAFLERLREDIA